MLLLLLLCFFGHVTNVKAQENLKIYRCWGKLHFVLGLLARDIPNHSYVQNTPYPGLKPLEFFEDGLFTKLRNRVLFIAISSMFYTSTCFAE